MTLFPWSIWNCLWLAPLALAMDLLFGDPRLPWPHPVIAIGNFLNLLEKSCRRFMALAPIKTRKFWELLSGFIALLLTLLLVGSIACLLVNIPFIAPVFAIYLAWAGLAGGCLLDTGRKVLESVETDSLAKARASVSCLVSRDTSQMNQETLRKTLADTLSENLTDAFIAPFFWLCLLGPVGLWLYKAVSTMDSQWGYLTPPWKNLGFAGAKGDDLLAFVPARISAIALMCTHKFCHWLKLKSQWQGKWPGLSKIAKDAMGMPSPNSGWSMAAASWLCNCRMAGPSVYFGQMVNKPWLGPPQNAFAWNKIHLQALCQLIFRSYLAGGLLIFLGFLAIRIVIKITGLISL